MTGREETIQLAHGGGGRAMARLIETVIRPAFDDPELDRGHDGAVLELEGPLAFTTDSYVVRPLVFPGGDIGTWPSTARSTTSPCAGRSRCTSASA